MNAPGWFSPPTASAIARPRRSIFSGERRELVYRVVEHMRAGEFALAPWQRPYVWTEEQQVHLLDSLMRGVSVGAITIWQPPPEEGVGRPFEGCPIGQHAQLVADGQQRLTTLLMAAAGGLDNWRWNGEGWVEGRGFLTPSMAVRGTSSETLDWYGWLRGMGLDREVIDQCVRDLEAVARTDLHFLVLDGTAEHMVETYRRLATTGAPHSVADLELMESWLASRQVAPTSDGPKE